MPDSRSEGAVYRTSVSTDPANSSRFFFDSLDAAQEFVEARLAAADDATFGSWKRDDDGGWIAYSPDGWIVGAVTRETIHPDAEQALRAQEDTYGERV